MYGEKAWRQLHKNAASNIEQVLVVTPHKTAGGRWSSHQSLKLYKLDEPDMQDTAGEVRTNSEVTYFGGPLHVDEQRLDDELEPIYICSESDVTLKTSWERWTIETGGERESGRSMLAVRYYYYYYYYYYFTPKSFLHALAEEFLMESMWQQDCGLNDFHSSYDFHIWLFFFQPSVTYPGKPTKNSITVTLVICSCEKLSLSLSVN